MGNAPFLYHFYTLTYLTLSTIYSILVDMMTRQEKRNLRRQAHVDSLHTFNRNTGEVDGKWFIQVPFTHRQRQAEWLRAKASRANPIDTRLLPWQ